MSSWNTRWESYLFTDGNLFYQSVRIESGHLPEVLICGQAERGCHMCDSLVRIRGEFPLAVGALVAAGEPGGVFGGEFQTDNHDIAGEVIDR
jgi:hypothetical protein